MRSTIIDLSVSISDVPTEPAHHRPVIDYIDHDASFPAFSDAYGGVNPKDLPDGKAWAVERVTMSTHAGTHMDAPYHFHPTTNHRFSETGEPAPTIDEISLDICMRPGVKLDFRYCEPGYTITPEDIERELDRIEYAIQPLDIVLVNTRAGTRHRERDYLTCACGFGREATLHLIDKGVAVVGTDAYSWDPPFSVIGPRYRETGDASLLWAGHKAGRERPYWQMEKLCNLEQLPATGFTVICFPIKIHRASAGWTRAVAVLNPIGVAAQGVRS